MGQALYRKYRSKSLSEIVGQEHIVTTLQNALKKGSISHAYLFTGPRGVGKTSIARILAHEINDLPYDEESSHIDIIEIDAASNRRIDEIRDLRDKVHIAPTSAKYKVYIIDEVHMLTKEAFNALLKTLEEPPAHVVFILATTEAHKVPETIVSRTQRFTFKAIEPEKAVQHLKEIAKQEKLQVSDEALELIAEHGDGSFRDSIGLLDQLSSHHAKVEADDVREMLGIAPNHLIEQLFNDITHGSAKNILDTLQVVTERGYEATLVARQLAQYVRQKLLAEQHDAAVLTRLLNLLIEVPASNDPFAKLEVVLIGINLEERAEQIIAEQPDKAQTVQKSPATSQPVAKPASKASKAPTEAKKETSKSAAPVTDDFNEAWSNVLQAIKKQNNTLYGILRMAQPSIEDDEVTLKCQFPFHQKKLNEEKTRQQVSRLLSEQLGRPLKLKCQVDKDLKTPTPSFAEEKTEEKPSSTGEPVLDTISNIFGAAEVLES